MGNGGGEFRTKDEEISERGDSTRHRFITDPYGAQHYEKLGRFIFQYAQAETHFHLALRYYSQMPIAEARMLFGGRGTRLSDVIDRTKRLIKLYKVKKELADDFCDIAKQFSKIGEKRNHIIHRGWHAYADTFLVSDIATARVVDEPEIASITFAEMDDMIEDLIRIWMRIRFRHIEPERHEELRNVAASWRYNPPGRGKSRKQSGKRPRKPSSSP
jgi:hypothetical protein